MTKGITSLIIATILTFFTLPSEAQQPPVVAVYSLSSTDVGDHIAKTVNDLVFSFVRELRSYRIVDMRLDQVPRDLGVPDGTDYLFFGTMTNEPDGIKLELVLKGGPFGVTRLLSRVYENSNRILLESRMLVRDLFDQSVKLPEPSAQPALAGVSIDGAVSRPQSALELRSVESVDSLAGSWKGEEGVERIMLLRGGRGVAVLSSGVSIPLEVLTAGDNLVIRQKGSANPRQFADLPDPVAKQAATIAPPLEWNFRITPDQRTLVGTKKTSSFVNDGTTVISMDSLEQGVSWTRF